MANARLLSARPKLTAIRAEERLAAPLINRAVAAMGFASGQPILHPLSVTLLFGGAQRIMLIPKRYVFRIRLHSVRFYLRGRRCDCQRSIPWRGCFPRPLDQILAYRLDDHDAFQV